jgi:hypothetical protein
MGVAFFHFCCKVDHQPAGNGEKDGTVATKKAAEKVKTGRLYGDTERWTEIHMWHSARKVVCMTFRRVIWRVG